MAVISLTGNRLPHPLRLSSGHYELHPYSTGVLSGLFKAQENTHVAEVLLSLSHQVFLLSIETVILCPYKIHSKARKKTKFSPSAWLPQPETYKTSVNPLFSHFPYPINHYIHGYISLMLLRLVYRHF